MKDEYKTYKVVLPNVEKTKTKYLLKIMDLFKTIFNFLKPCPFVHIPGCMHAQKIKAFSHINSDFNMGINKNSTNKQRLF